MKPTYHWYIPSPKDTTGADREPQVIRIDGNSAVFFGIEDAVETGSLKGFLGPALSEPNA